MTLRTYIVKRVITAIFILWVVATFNFLFFPSPVANIYLQPPETPYFSYQPDPDTARMLLLYFGWNDSLHIRYLKYLYSLFTFGTAPPYFGWSTLHRKFVAGEIYSRLPITLFLLGTALIGSMIIGIPIGVVAASKHGTKKDIALTTSALFTLGLPSFYVLLIAIFFVGDVLRQRFGITTLATTWGTVLVNRQEAPLQWWSACLWQLALPIIALVLVGFGAWVIRCRFILLDNLTKDFITTARAKGLSERVVLWKHAFKIILPQIATMITLSLPSIVTGTFIIEYLFGIEGIGQYLIYAIQMGDVTIFVLDTAVVQAVFFICATLIVSCNLIADIIYGVLDPRIR